DLEAMARAVPALQPADLHPIVQGKPVRSGSIAVIAPGTGLGEAFLTWDGDRYVAHASEGGHADFAPTDQLQIALLRFLQPRFGHVSVERVCSGLGIPNIYDFYRQREPHKEKPDVGREIDQAADRTKKILEIALERPHDSALCDATLKTFISILGA